MPKETKSPRIPPPKTYLASPLYHAPMWRDWKTANIGINIVSTWHDSLTIETDDKDRPSAVTGWRKNFVNLVRCKYLLAFAHTGDQPNGTLVEIGVGISKFKSIHLVGGFPWGSWKYSPYIHEHDSLHTALLAIKKDHYS